MSSRTLTRLLRSRVGFDVAFLETEIATLPTVEFSVGGLSVTATAMTELTDASGTAFALNAREAYGSLGGLSKDTFGERTV